MLSLPSFSWVAFTVTEKSFFFFPPKKERKRKELHLNFRSQGIYKQPYLHEINCYVKLHNIMSLDICIYPKNHHHHN